MRLLKYLPVGTKKAGARRAADQQTIVETSLGMIVLTLAEHDTLVRLLAGQAILGEGQAFYQSLIDRNGAFPMEWEVHILRAGVAAFPDRPDLISRLAVVEDALIPKTESTDVAEALAFERARARFMQSNFAKLGNTARQAILDDACLLLSSRVFGQQPLAQRVEIVVALHNTLMSMPSRDLPIVAELGLRRFRAMLQEPTLTERDACAVYDCLHSLYFAGVSDVRELLRFDGIVPTFERWLEQRHGRHVPPNVEPTAGRKLTVAYLVHTAHFDRGNAVSPLICSLAEMHATRSDRRILVYAVQHIGAGFVERMENRGLVVRAFDQRDRYDRIDEIAASLKSDRVDILITEQNRAIAASLFVRRMAPRQLWIDTGFPFWNLSGSGLDGFAGISARPDCSPKNQLPQLSADR